MAVILGKTISKSGIASDYLDAIQFQPGGIDLSLRDVYKFKGSGVIDFWNKNRRLAPTEKVAFSKKEKLKLNKGCYKIVYNEYIKIPTGCIGLAFPRSSLLRCGAFIHCAVWDPGYEGRSESLLVVANENGIWLEKNARLVQLILLKLEKSAEQGYQGVYMKENRAKGKGVGAKC
ncbi:MAG: deoxyuridine 5'-triphosphate nucleotidohydrolase [Candidatus Anstonellales archaeon]